MFKKKIPTKRVVISGCRDYNNYDEAKLYIDFCLCNVLKKNNIIIVSVVVEVQMLLESAMQKRMGLVLKSILPIGKSMEKAPDREEINKWQK